MTAGSTSASLIFSPTLAMELLKLSIHSIVALGNSRRLAAFAIMPVRAFTSAERRPSLYPKGTLSVGPLSFDVIGNGENPLTRARQLLPFVGETGPLGSVTTTAFCPLSARLR